MHYRNVFRLLSLIAASFLAPSVSAVDVDAVCLETRGDGSVFDHCAATPPLKAGCLNPEDNPEPAGLQGRRYTGTFSQDQATLGHLQGGGRPENQGVEVDITCNTKRIAAFTTTSKVLHEATGGMVSADEVLPLGSVGGFRTHRYLDEQGNECAFYDTQLLVGTSLGDLEGGVNVLRVERPDEDSVQLSLTSVLKSAAMMSPHESLVISQERGVLAAVLGNPALGPGVVDVYSLEEGPGGCTLPMLKASAPVGVFGHEGALSPDGRVFYAASPATPTLTAVDISNLSAPVPIWTGEYCSHGLMISEDGNTAFLSHNAGTCRGGGYQNGFESIPIFGPAFAGSGSLDISGKDRNGFLVLDVSDINTAAGTGGSVADPFPSRFGEQDYNPPERRQLSGEPQVPEEIGFVSWPNVTVPQNALPVRIQGKPYVIEVDEYAADTQYGTVGQTGSAAIVGGARIIGFRGSALSEYANPFVLSNLRLAVHHPENRAALANDPGAQPAIQGYAAHYCAVPTRDNPTIVACSMIVSGLRVFDIRNPAKPVETAYFNAAIPRRATPYVTASNFAMSAPAFVPERKEIWYTDGLSGFYVLRLNDAGWPDWNDSRTGREQGRRNAKGRKN